MHTENSYFYPYLAPMKDHFAPKLSHNVSVYLRIEIHILSLHWMMKTLAILMSVKP